MKTNKLLVLASSTLLTLALVACGNNVPASSSKETQSESETSETISSSTTGDTSDTPATTLTYKEAATSALAYVNLVSEQSVSYDQWGDKYENTFYYGEDQYGQMIKSINKDPYSTTTRLVKYLSNGELVSVYSYDDGESWNASYEAVLTAGKDFEFDDTYYGAEALIDAVARNSACTEVKASKNNAWKISALTEIETEYSNHLNKAEIEFTLGSYGALNEATIALTSYYNYDKKNDGTYTIKGEGSSVVYTVKNTCGTKMSKDEYNIEQYYSTSWSLTDEDETVIDENYVVTTSCGSEDSFVVKFKDILPTTADLHIDKPKLTIYQNDVACDENLYSAFYNNDVFECSVSSLPAGEYEAEIKTVSHSATFKIVINIAKPTSFNFSNYDYDLGEYTQRESENGKTDGYNFTGSTYVNRPIYLDASTSPEATGGKVVAECTSEYVKIEETTIKPTVYSEKNVLKITASMPGTYQFNLSNVDFPDGIKATYTLTVTEAPSLSDVVANKYVSTSYSGIKFEISFDPTTATGTTGNVTIMDGLSDYSYDSDAGKTTYVKHTNTYSYEYNSETSEFELTLVSGDDLNNEDWKTPSLGLSSRGLPIINSNYDQYSSNSECSVDTPKARLTNRRFTYGNSYSKVEDVSNFVTYDFETNEDGLNLTFKDLRKAVWVDDEDVGGYYNNYDTYIYTATNEWTLSPLTDGGYRIDADWVFNDEDSLITTRKDEMATDEIFKTITVSSDWSTMTITTASNKTYTLGN